MTLTSILKASTAATLILTGTMVSADGHATALQKTVPVATSCAICSKA